MLLLNDLLLPHTKYACTMELSDNNPEPTKALMLTYMTILFALVSGLSMLGLFLLSKIYWTAT
jgi:hypothetical protein